MNRREAIKIFSEVLFGLLQASQGTMHDFVFRAINRPDSEPMEYRIQGKLGFGGKFHDDGHRWFVACYSEDRTPEIDTLIGEANKKLAEIRSTVYPRTATEAINNALREFGFKHITVPERVEVILDEAEAFTIGSSVEEICLNELYKGKLERIPGVMEDTGGQCDGSNFLIDMDEFTPEAEAELFRVREITRENAIRLQQARRRKLEKRTRETK